ncbi:hypothetical protein D3C81_2029690 [compost metagenome]
MSVMGIENSFTDTRSKIDSLISSIGRVTESARFISDISKQTNLTSHEPHPKALTNCCMKLIKKWSSSQRLQRIQAGYWLSSLRL